jgi:hypothetical protein
MRCGKIPWITSENTMCIDLQPNSYRILLAGGSNTIEMYNLLPIVDQKHELDPEEEKKEDEIIAGSDTGSLPPN